MQHPGVGDEGMGLVLEDIDETLDCADDTESEAEVSLCPKFDNHLIFNSILHSSQVSLILQREFIEPPTSLSNTWCITPQDRTSLLS